MPELPEVEATRLSFADRIVGAIVQTARLGKPLRWPLGCPSTHLQGRVVQEVQRRGKYLLLMLDRGVLILHLGMSGSLRFAVSLPAPGAHDHFDLITNLGTLRLNDPRRFGAAIYVADLQAPLARKLLDTLGVEPLSDAFNPTQLLAGLRKRSAPVKQVLLAGDVVVGVGNIYASEALFLAGIHPATPAHRIGATRCTRLHASIVQVLREALDSGGSTLRNFSDAYGHSGQFQLRVRVYDRAGQPCRRCEGTVRLLRQGQRSTYYCPRCQRG